MFAWSFRRLHASHIRRRDACLEKAVSEKLGRRIKLPRPLMLEEIDLANARRRSKTSTSEFSTATQDKPNTGLTIGSQIVAVDEGRSRRSLADEWKDDFMQKPKGSSPERPWIPRPKLPVNGPPMPIAPGCGPVRPQLDIYPTREVENFSSIGDGATGHTTEFDPGGLS